MARKTWVIVVLILVGLCVLSMACGALGAAGWLFYQRFVLRTSTPVSQAVTPPPERAVPQTPQPGATGASPAPRTTPSGPDVRRMGGTLRIMGGRPPTLDPALVQDSTSAEYIVHLFSGLVSLNAHLEIIPDLAREWSVSADGKRYTFYLLNNAAFQDGKPIKAQDFVYSMERACSPKLASPVAETYLGDIVGVPEYIAGRAERIAGLKALDDYTLQIDIDAPKAYFLAKLTYHTAFVVDKAQVERDGRDWLNKPNCSGPFTLESRTNERIVLARNPRYAGNRPALDKVEYLLGGGQPVTMYENDQIDLVEVPPSEMDRVLDPDNPLSDELRVSTRLTVHYLGLNVQIPPCDDPAVRKALAYAIDKQKIAEVVLKGTAAPARGILPSALPDFDETFTGIPYDPARAKELLASSRYAKEGQMPPLVLAISGTSGHLSGETRAIVHMLEQNLGLKVTVEQIDWADFLRDLNARRYQMFITGWVADYPDAQNFLDILFHSQSGQNHLGYANPQVDKLLEQARVEGDPAKRRALYRQAERMIVDDVAWVPLSHGVVHLLVKPYVKGYQGDPAIYPWLKDIYLVK